MTVLPTVRRQLTEAAERQATSRPAGIRARMSAIRSGHSRPADGVTAAGPISPPRRVRISPGAVAAAFSVIVAVGVAIGAIALLGHGRTAATSPATRPADYRLTGIGIGNITFGQGPETVAAGLERLLGRPATAGAASRIGYVRGICGFDHEIFWTGLAARPNGSNSDGLTVYFKHSRFVGYSYGPPYGGPQAPAVRSGPTLSTTKGLGLDDALARGRQLYGRAFVVTSQAQGTPPSKPLGRLPFWELHTASGRLYGYIDSPGGPDSTQQRTIGSISAGAIPNTPCH